MTRVAGKKVQTAPVEAPPESQERRERRRKQESERLKAESAAARSAEPLMLNVSPAPRPAVKPQPLGAGSGSGRVTRRKTDALPRVSPLRIIGAGVRAVFSIRISPVRQAKALFASGPTAGPMDSVLACAVVLLVFFGLVMVYSASAVHSQHVYNNAEFLALKQVIFAVVGLSLMFWLSGVDYRRYRRLSGWALLGSIGLLMVTISGAGTVGGGASRWIRFGGVFNIQPAELAKVAMIMWLSSSLATKAERVHTFWIGYLPHVIAAGMVGGLCLMQPDFGSAVMVGLITLVLLVTAGARFRYIVPSVLVSLPLAYAAVAYSPYRRARFEAFRAPFEHLQTGGYQLAKSQLAFGTGGLRGIGLGDSKQKLFFLPEAHTDFIAAVIGEELGLFGMALLVGLFCLVFLRGIQVAFRARDDFGTYLATGLSMFVALQVFVNLAVTVGLMPTKGLVLPFISYGGSAMLVNCSAIGILLSVSRSRLANDAGAATGWTGAEEGSMATGGLV